MNQWNDSIFFKKSGVSLNRNKVELRVTDASHHEHFSSRRNRFTAKRSIYGSLWFTDKFSGKKNVFGVEEAGRRNLFKWSELQSFVERRHPYEAR